MMDKVREILSGFKEPARFSKNEMDNDEILGKEK